MTRALVSLTSPARRTLPLRTVSFLHTNACNGLEQLVAELVLPHYAGFCFTQRAVSLTAMWIIRRTPTLTTDLPIQPGTAKQTYTVPIASSSSKLSVIIRACRLII